MRTAEKKYPRKAEARNLYLKRPITGVYGIRHQRKGLLPHLRADFEEIKHKDWFKDGH